MVVEEMILTVRQIIDRSVLSCSELLAAEFSCFVRLVLAMGSALNGIQLVSVLDLV
jgi:hypothetical protein